jgi:hypothetical protein
MPVDNQRFAAVNRTPPSKPGSRSRLRLTLTWLTIVAALTFFTFTVAATAAGSKPDYAGAAKGLRADQPRVVIKTGGKEQVCSVNQTQLAQLDAAYEIGWMTVTIDGSSADLVTVAGANDHDMHSILGDAKCRLVKEKHVFYLPFDAQTS